MDQQVTVLFADECFPRTEEFGSNGSTVSIGGKGVPKMISQFEQSKIKKANMEIPMEAVHAFIDDWLKRLEA
ncbi:hypothetical protein TNCV_4985331 [Trichonephila clavipes]|nr:hypothetical protein TNCV_4985331 [Trichonephila clavipes]